MEPSIYLEVAAYGIVALLVGWAAWSNYRVHRWSQPAKGYEPPYMVGGMDFTQFPRGKGRNEGVKWIRAKFKELGNAKPTLALCEQLLDEYYTKYPSNIPTIAEQRARNAES